MLEKFEVLNGTMAVKFDKLNTQYSVILNEGESQMDFSYNIAPTDQISIYTLKINANQSNVVISVYNDLEIMSYYFDVYMPSVKASNNILTYESLEIKSTDNLPIYIAPLISSVCFTLILLIFTKLFARSKKLKNK